MSTQATQTFTTNEALLEMFLRSRTLIPKKYDILDIFGEYLGLCTDDRKILRGLFDGYFIKSDPRTVVAVLSSRENYPQVRILEMSPEVVKACSLNQKLRDVGVLKVLDSLPVLEDWHGGRCDFEVRSPDSAISIHGTGIVDDRVSSSCLTGKCHFYSSEPIVLVVKPDLGQEFSSTLLDQLADFLADKALNMGTTTFDAKASGHLKFIDQLA